MQQGSRPFGGISGFTLKIARHSAHLSQASFAEAIGADPTSVQSWEAGRRPLASAAMSQLQRITRALLRNGAGSNLVAMIPPAVEADLVITAIAAPRSFDELDQHPLSGRVMDLRLAELVTWALNGASPRFAEALTPTRRRGPVPQRPELDQQTLRSVKSNLLELGEHRERSASENILLRRQACFLAGVVGLNAPVGLSTRASRHLVGSRSWTPSWADARSFAASCAYRGDPEPLRDFIAHAHATEDCEVAALNYTAYWVGDLPDGEGDDLFMVSESRRWRGSRMFPHLVSRLEPSHPLIDLQIHNLWLLLRAQRGLVVDDPETTNLLLERIDPLTDSDRVSRQSRRALRSIAEVLADLVPRNGAGRHD